MARIFGALCYRIKVFTRLLIILIGFTTGWKSYKIWQSTFTKHPPRSKNMAVSPLTKIILEYGVTFDFFTAYSQLRLTSSAYLCNLFLYVICFLQKSGDVLNCHLNVVRAPTSSNIALSMVIHTSSRSVFELHDPSSFWQMFLQSTHVPLSYCRW